MGTSGLSVQQQVVDEIVGLVRERVAQDQQDLVVDLVERYFEGTAPEDLAARTITDLYGAVLSHWQLGRQRPPATPKVRLTNPDVDEHGWQSPHTVVDVVTDDMPFLVDSISMVLHRNGCGIHLVVHPLLAVDRDRDGSVTKLGDDRANEAWIHIEIDRQASNDRRSALAREIVDVLGVVRAAVEDWEEMRARAVAAAQELTEVNGAPGDRAEAAELLRWLADDHFTFLGFRRYERREEAAGDVWVAVPGTGMGLLRDELRPLTTQHADDLGRSGPPRDYGRLVTITRANARSPIHRPDHLALVSVYQRDGSGTVVGEQRFIGLYTALTYRGSAMDIPYLHRKVEAVLQRAGYPLDSHSGRELWNILESYPRDELFEIDVDELYRITTAVLHLQERKQVRLLARRDDWDRYVSCLVYVPRERYSTTVVQQMEAVLLAAFGGVSAEHDTLITESVLSRVHFLVQLSAQSPQDVDLDEVERQLAHVTRWWVDDLRDALVEAFGEDEGLAIFGQYEHAFPAAYREQYGPRQAVHDVRRIEALAHHAGIGTAFHRPVEASEGDIRLKLYTAQAMTLSEVLPLLEDMGVRVTDERPFDIHRADGVQVWLYDIGLRCMAGARIDERSAQDEFRATFAALLRGDIETDGFNRLVLLAGLTARQVMVLRGYAKYLRQIGTTFSQQYVEQVLARHPAVVAKLVELFNVRFDPALEGHRALEAAGIGAEIAEALDDVASLDEDRILRSFLTLIEATTRTSFFRPRSDGTANPVVSFKLDPSRVPDLPLPRPMFEIWVYSPRVEGVHLRGGPVARGGLRWSDRREDFRTEVLGLMKAQMVKNAVIVPVGAKGGFVVKRPPAEAEALRAEVVFCYKAFVSALLDVTDNIVGGVLVPPPDVVRHDGDDPYLVVAADKGTATFSDIANEISISYGFWLGDAFASGGSAGYDHKEMGITAKGAWESVRRHFRILGLDADAAPITCVGIGDMSGDVFGNGMLLSDNLRLLAAFDHRHIFLDPDPDPAASWTERKRLFDLPRSSWADYDTALISAGGGVHPRTAKAITLSDEVREALDIDARALTPNELINAILRAPVDLLWNGGIGTYVKASGESNADVGDRANDGLRVNGDDLRCRVVGEGGNLGFTQRGRIEFALRGGLIHTDAIDNSAGVDCSDHEVNIKILLNSTVSDGDLTMKQRDELLHEMTDEVAEQVLEDNYAQNVALAIAREQAGSMVDVHARYVRSLELEGLINRELERLPSEQEFARRQMAGTGLTTPEFGVLLAYTKTTNVDELVRSDVPEDPFVHRYLVEYFPRPLRQRFADRMARHPLRREIIATVVVNQMVNRAGTSFDYRMSEETGAPVSDITRAHLASRAIFDLDIHWSAIEALDGAVESAVQLELFIELRRLVERGCVWLLRHRRPPLDIGATVAAFGGGVAELAPCYGDLVAQTKRGAIDSARERYISAGVPPELAARAASWPLLHTLFDILEIAPARGRAPADVVGAYWALFDRLDLDWVWDRIGLLPRNDRWQTHARAALRDDLLAALRDLTDDALRSGDVFDPPAQLIEQWRSTNERAAERAAKAFKEIRSSNVFDLTTLSVALRQLRNLVLSSR